MPYFAMIFTMALPTMAPSDMDAIAFAWLGGADAEADSTGNVGHGADAFHDSRQIGLDLAAHTGDTHGLTT